MVGFRAQVLGPGDAAAAKPNEFGPAGQVFISVGPNLFSLVGKDRMKY